MTDKEYIIEIKKWLETLEDYTFDDEPDTKFALKQVQWLLDYIEDMELPKKKKSLLKRIFG